MKTLRLLLVLALSAPAAFAADEVVVNVWHTNDVHGWFMPRSNKSTSTPRMIGGLAAMKALMDKDKGPKLLVDGGDWWQGTPEGSLTKGAAAVEVFNAMGYAAAAVGNHDFDAGQDVLKSLVKGMRMASLSANTYGPDGKHVPWLRQRVIKEVAGIKFGIFGLTPSKMINLQFPKYVKGLTFRREIDEARDQVKALKKEGADVIIALTHVGVEVEGFMPFEGDKALAREVPGIDLIVGGHNHVPLFDEWHDPANGTMVVQAGRYLERVGRSTLRIDRKTRKVVSSWDDLIDLDPAAGEDPVIKALVDRQVETAGKAFDVVVATAAETIRHERDSESPVGLWAADCYRSWAGTDFSLQNGCGVRTPIKAGPITRRDLFGLMPFDNRMVKLSIPGAKLRAALDHGFGGICLLQVSGADVVYRRSGPPGTRAVSLKVGGVPLDDAKTYTVVTLDFVVSHAENGNELASVPSETSEMLTRDLLEKCAREQGTLRNPPLGRMVHAKD